MRIAAAILLALVPTLALAQPQPLDEEHRGPRPEAIAACKDKNEGDSCEFDAPKGHVAGTCHKTHAGDLACGHPHHHDAGSS